MGLNATFVAVEPARSEIDALTGLTLLEFGAPWCEHCQAAQPLIAEAFSGYPEVRHIRVEDGKGRPLGRSFTVKMWPCLIFLKDGKELERLVRPHQLDEIKAVFARGVAA